MAKVIGSFEKVSLPEFNLHDIIAKIDTGATTGSLHATHIEETSGPGGEKVLSFRAYGREPAVLVKSFRTKEIKSSNGESEHRYIIRTTIILRDVHYPIRLSLTDRSSMKKGMLIGRRFLRRNHFVVDVKQGTKYRGEVKEKS